MNKEKWYQLYNQSVNKFMRKMIVDDVDNWSENRSLLLGMIKEVDEATEVYNLENTKKEIK